MGPKQPVVKELSLLERLAAYLSSYVSFSSPDYVIAGTLWAAATHLWPEFDAFPYLVITSDTKRSGKTRFSELLSFASANSLNMAGVTPAALFREIDESKPTIFIDEAEAQGAETADLMRTVLNIGYRRGQTVARTTKTGVKHYNVYCPKCFILIGDVRDTLRDRSIVVRMKRAEAPKRFLWATAEAEGNALRDELHERLDELKGAIYEKYTTHEGLGFLPDRDEEIWLPLFAVCAVLAPQWLTDLQRVAVDIATEKTMEARRVSSDELAAAESEAMAQEYGVRLLNDLRTVLGNRRHLYTAEALEALKALSTGPWRRFKGEGLTVFSMSNLLKPFGVGPKNIRQGGKYDGTVRRGYTRESIEGALKRSGTGK